MAKLETTGSIKVKGLEIHVKEIKRRRFFNEVILVTDDGKESNPHILRVGDTLTIPLNVEIRP